MSHLTGLILESLSRGFAHIAGEQKTDMCSLRVASVV